nr:helix-turn-helix transcriptional regulator [uncultured Mediterraneibacter sp.]
MPKPCKNTGEKNLISANLIKFRKERNYSQRLLAYQLQLNGYDMDKNVITRIETNKRYVTDIELRALCQVLDVTYEELMDG